MRIEYGGFNQSMIRFNSRDSYYKTPFGAVEENTKIFFKIEVEGDRPVLQAYLVMSWDEGETQFIVGEVQHTQCCFSWTAEETGLYFYHFKVIYEDSSEETTPINQLTVSLENKSETPEWLKNGVMYQIFPDRFAKNKNYKAPPQNKRYISRENWGDLPISTPDKDGIVWNHDFFEGNLNGVIDNLDYLAELGITVIYMNPIFEAFSNHRYDTANYKKIDPMLGNEEIFIELCKQAEQRGIRIILDGVFNHTGSDSLYFNKEGRFEEIGAFQSKASKYADWYSFIEFPNKYEAWWGIETLPAVNESSQSYMTYILNDADSVVKHWLRCGASGFRLDVADELPDHFLDQLRVAVKSVKPNAAIIGEVWEDASNKVAYSQRRRYFQGKQLDSVMNYPLKDAIISYISGKLSSSAFANIIETLWENYPAPHFYSCMNILGTHDTSRILTVFLNEDGSYFKAKQKLYLSLLLWAFLPGIPCIYYGDELGMEGGRDPLNRGCFSFEKRDDEIFMYYKRLLFFRNSIKDLEKFKFHPEISLGNLYGFSRRFGKKTMFVLINMGEYEEVIALEDLQYEKLLDFFLCGTVNFNGIDTFALQKESGIVVYFQ